VFFVKGKIMFSKLTNKTRALVAVVPTMALASPAFAQTEENPIVQFIEAVGLAGVSAAVIAAGLLIVGIALAFKGPDLGKRVIRKV
jgi:hypothetical protein